MAALEQVAVKKEAGKTIKPRSETEHQTVVSRLHHLRLEARQTSRAYLSNLERTILDLIDAMADDAARRHARLKSDSLSAMLRKLKGMSLRPEKGRRKDLKRIENTVSELLQMISRKKD